MSVTVVCRADRYQLELSRIIFCGVSGGRVQWDALVLTASVVVVAQSKAVLPQLPAVSLQALRALTYRERFYWTTYGHWQISERPVQDLNGGLQERTASTTKVTARVVYLADRS